MGKVALLIGVGEYQLSSGLQNLAAAARDVAAMRDVLVQSGIGGFAEADVTVLLNPEPQGMREALERLFAGRKADDLVVLYFSGHGVVDDFGTFHLTTARTDKGLLNSTAIPAGFVHGLMEGQGSKRQVVILDCCFSGAFAKDMKAKGEAVNLQPQLGGKGRAVLTSSSATEYSFEQKEAELSVYTQYVVEGLRTGIADGDGDGWISVDELHEFAQGKVREVAPAMQPKIYAVEEGYKIRLANAPRGDLKLQYRKEVEKFAEQKQGKLSDTILMALETKQEQWGLDSDVAAVILQEVLRPYEEFAAKCQKYQQAVQRELQQENRLSQEAWEDLQYLQETLGLKDENIQPFIRNIEILPVATEQPKVMEKMSGPVVSKSAAGQPIERDLNVTRSTEHKRPELKHRISSSAGPTVSSTRATVLDHTRSRKSTTPQNDLKKKWMIVLATTTVSIGSIRAISGNLPRSTPLPSREVNQVSLANVNQVLQVKPGPVPFALMSRPDERRPGGNPPPIAGEKIGYLTPGTIVQVTDQLTTKAQFNWLRLKICSVPLEAKSLPEALQTPGTEGWQMLDQIAPQVTLPKTLTVAQLGTCTSAPNQAQ
jgi:Caspase domain